MCGIFGLTGEKNLIEILKKGISNLEYRGYDSTGVALLGNKLEVIKGIGTINHVLAGLNFNNIIAGIAHTRWATHGKPNKVNAHPHTDCNKTIAVIHNGIIENYSELKNFLEKKGHKFKSHTDTEVVPHLIEEFKYLGEFKAFKKAISLLKGSYAILAVFEKSKRIYFARNLSPLVLGVGSKIFLASDVVAFLNWTKYAIFLEDGDLGFIEGNKYYIEKNNREVKRAPIKIEWDINQAEKDGYEHFMLKEIFEQPDSIKKTTMDSRLVEFSQHLSELDKLVLTSAGTSFHAGLAFKYVSSLPLETILASEFNELYRGGSVFAISQSGETADTLNAIRFAKKQGEEINSLVNVVGSTLTRMSKHIIYTHSGPEIGVAATKTFTSQLAALYTVDAYMKGKKRPSFEVNEILQLNEITKHIAKKLTKATSAFYIGRGASSVTAMEGALKLKEIAYLHAEAYPGGELKHGPLALIENDVPVISICPLDKTHNKMLGNTQEVKTRGAYVIGLGQSEDSELKNICDEFIPMPDIPKEYSPLYYTIPLQLLAYHTSIMKGYNPDKPRNLAKSVTVE